MNDAEAATDFITGRYSGYKKAKEYYEGEQSEIFSHPKLRRALANVSQDFRFNFSAVVVDSVLNRLTLADVRATNARQQARVDKLWAENEWSFEVGDLHRWALVYGDHYLLVWPNDSTGLIDMIPADPLTTAVFYEPTNQRIKRYAARLWQEGEGSRLTLYYPDRIEKYWSKEPKPTKTTVWTQLIDDANLLFPLPNPTSEIPVFHYRTRRPYGRPEHRDAYGPQDMLDKLAQTHMSSVDYNGFPQRYALANPADDGDSSDLESYTDEDVTETDLPDQRLNAHPGSLWYMSGVQTVGQFPVADPDAFLRPFKEYVKALSSVTSTPLRFFEGVTGAPSGESLRAADAPLIQKAETYQTLFGSTHRQAWAYALRISSGPASDVLVNWDSPVSSEDKDYWDVVQKKIDAGVKREVALREAGYDDESITDVPAPSTDAAATGSSDPTIG